MLSVTGLPFKPHPNIRLKKLKPLNCLLPLKGKGSSVQSLSYDTTYSEKIYLINREAYLVEK